VTSFSFENTLKLTESQYLEVWALVPSGRRSRLIRRGALAAVGVVFLFSPYTLLLGVAVLAAGVFYAFAPRMIPAGARSTFRQHEYLRDELTCGVSDERLWVRSERLDAAAAWSMLAVWRERAGWLVLSPSGIPPVYLSVERLKAEGLYERVLALAKRHGKEFNSGVPAR
jgi:hypothetical protein